jgi:hypothetical protein
MKTKLILIALLVLSKVSFLTAQSVEIVGPTQVAANTTEAYSVTFTGITPYDDYEWSSVCLECPNGYDLTILGRIDGADISWGVAPASFYIEYTLRQLDNFYSDYIIVNIVEPPSPYGNFALPATSTAATSFIANWNQISGFTDYRLQVSTSSSFPANSLLLNTVVTATSKIVTVPAGGTTYYYRVRPEGSTGYSNVISVLTLPSAPPALSPTGVSNTSFTARWSTVASATEYNVDVATDNTFQNLVWMNASAGVASELLITGLEPNVKYYYRIRAKNATGTSLQSNVISLTTISIPIAIAATDVLPTSFAAQWNPVAGASGYRLDVSKQNTFSTFVTGYNNLPVTGPGHVVSGLETGIPHYYRVRSVTASGTSASSGLILVTPSLQITATNNGYIAMGAPVVLTTNGIFTTYVWKNSGGTVVSTNPSFSTSVPGVYNLTVTKDNLNASASYTVKDGRINTQQTTRNYISRNTILVDNITDPNVVETLPVESRTHTVQYFDGLGRLSQTIVTQGSSSKKDIVQPVEYDAYGREAIKYLPYVPNEVTGLYKPDFIGKGNGLYTSPAHSPHFKFYQQATKTARDTKPYSETVFEASPMNEVLKQGAAGEVWQPDNNPNSIADKTIKIRSEFNTAGDAVVQFAFNFNTSQMSIASNVFYPANQLYTKETFDEHNNQISEFTDKEGRVLLKRIMNGTQRVDTYYIYDDYGNLAIVLPPEAVKALGY